MTIDLVGFPRFFWLRFNLNRYGLCSRSVRLHQVTKNFFPLRLSLVNALKRLLHSIIFWVRNPESEPVYTTYMKLYAFLYDGCIDAIEMP